MLIDTTILKTKIIAPAMKLRLIPRMSQKGRDACTKTQLWNMVVDLGKPFWRAQARGKLNFHGTIDTDGHSITILKTRYPSLAFGERQHGQPQEDFPNLDDQDEDWHQTSIGRVVLIDPNRRDLLYAMAEVSSPQRKRLYRYTRGEEVWRRKLQAYQVLREGIKATNPGVKAAELSLAAYNGATTDLDFYTKYLRGRQRNEAVLRTFYNRRIFFRLAFFSYRNGQKEVARLGRTLRTHFGRDPVLVVGNWSAPMQRYHEPIKGIGRLRRDLRSQGFEVVTLDEYRTSSLCPSCESKIKSFKRVPNPRTAQRETRPTALCYGLLRCEQCMIHGKPRLFNRDLAAVLNFRHILTGIRTTGRIPSRFQRQGAANQ